MCGCLTSLGGSGLSGSEMHNSVCLPCVREQVVRQIPPPSSFRKEAQREIHLTFLYSDEGSGRVPSLIKCVVFGNLLPFCELRFFICKLGTLFLGRLPPLGFCQRGKRKNGVQELHKLENSRDVRATLGLPPLGQGLLRTPSYRLGKRPFQPSP